jgi:fumarate reductase subunit D
MASSHKPIVWGLFAAGGTVAAFLVPGLILITCLAIPLGLLPADSLSYDNMIRLMQHVLARLIVFGVLFLITWHAAHRLRITAHDFGIRADTTMAILFYSIAAAGTLLLGYALISL